METINLIVASIPLAGLLVWVINRLFDIKEREEAERDYLRNRALQTLERERPTVGMMTLEERYAQRDALRDFYRQGAQNSANAPSPNPEPNPPPKPSPTPYSEPKPPTRDLIDY